MHSSSADLINLALLQSFSNEHNQKRTAIDDHIAASARRVLSTKVEFIHCPQYSTSNYLESLKSKYIVLKPNKPKKKHKKKKKKPKNKVLDESVDNKSQMKDIEPPAQNLTLPTPKIVLFPPDAVQLGWKATMPVGSGFVNLGTTCYINSTLQALFHVPSFVNWLLGDKKHHSACEKMNGLYHTECIVCAMSKTLNVSQKLNSGSVKPKYIIDKVKIICKHLSPFRQEDAHEFLRYLMEAMEKSYTLILGIQTKKLDSFSKETTPLNQIFGGYIRTEVTCLECSYISTTFQHFQDLILDIRQASTSTVYDGLENYFSKERLDGDESYHCEHCKKKVSAYKKFSIEKAPNVLCIQLKRFNISSFYGGSKISKLITIPQNIDLSKFKHKKDIHSMLLKYKLVSMVFHHGPSVNSGHYTALGCTSSGSYYYFNDEQVYPTNLGQYTNNPNAYIMFYELEKSANCESSFSIKTSSSNTVITLPNGYFNGAIQQRNNGFFTKRETSFSTSSNHSKQPSWVLTNTENKNSPVKSASAIAAGNVLKTTCTSLVPYMSSDSESSDLENDKSMDKNNNTHVADSNINDDKNQSASSSSMLSPLAKKNSTLTSLLTSSPKNENSTYRITTPTRVINNCKPLRLDLTNHTDNVKEYNQTWSDLKQEKRGIIQFSFFNRDKKKLDRNESSRYENSNNNKEEKCSENEPNEESTVDVHRAYFNIDAHEKNTENKSIKNDKGSTQSSEILMDKMQTNGITNGFGKMNANSTNGTCKTTTNGWIITQIEEKNYNDREKNQTLSSRGDWVITKETKKPVLVSTKDVRLNVEIRKNGEKYNGGINHNKNVEIQYDSENASNNYSYSSHNGYGGKVLTWNGKLSNINKESEQEHKETTKRNYNYDDDQDKGKIKKSKYYNGSENGSIIQQLRKNPIQQYHTNFMRGKRTWSYNNNHYHYNRRFSTNNHTYHRYNGNYSNNYNRTQNYVNNPWKR